MATRMPFDPRNDVPEEMKFMDAGTFHMRFSQRTPAWRPPTDVYETENALVVRVEVAGMNEDDFQIQLDGRYLSIRGLRTELPERRAYHQMEIHFGEFATEVELPFPVISNQVEAAYQNGFLRIVLPKSQPRQIPIQD